MYQRIGKSAYKADLSNTWKLSAYLEEPENHFKSIHVGGTNGKGSTSHMLASMLQEAGYRVGLYTSPHLKDFRERIKVNGKMIPKANVTSFIDRHKAFFEENELSFFEMTVGLAFDYFKDAQIDIAVIEVGLGGRLDSTNIITPEVSVITNIGLDHTQFLGDTLSQIAQEKAGIIKSGVPVVIGETTSETKKIFSKKAKDKDTTLVFAEGISTPDYKLDLLGDYQKKNLKTALATVNILKEKGWTISEKAIEQGLSQTVKNTGLLGRWQILCETPKVVCDTAHNREGLSEVLPQLLKEDYDKLRIVLGSVDDKNLNRILPLFPKNATYYYCKPNVARGMNANDLAKTANEHGLQGDVFDSVEMAYKKALKDASSGDLIYVGGSTFVVAEVL